MMMDELSFSFYERGVKRGFGGGGYKTGWVGRGRECMCVCVCVAMDKDSK